MSNHSSGLQRNAAVRRLTLRLHVQPAAGKSEIVGRHGDALKVRLAAPAADNKANIALIELLSASLGIPRSAIVIRHGATGRRKLIELTCGPESAALLERLMREDET
jgi:uncharacterized protein (TIGR00251 family)